MKKQTKVEPIIAPPAPASIVEFDIDPRAVYAMHVLAAAADIRYYLNGVLFEVYKDHIILVATDDHLLGARKINGETEGPHATFIMPLDLVLQCKPGRFSAGCHISYNLDTKQISVNLPGQTFQQPAVDGKFPDWRRVAYLKPDPDKGPAQFNPELPMRFSKFARIAGDMSVKKMSLVSIAHNGPDSAALVGVSCLSSEEFVGVVMPIRSDSLPTAPLWAKHVEEKVAQAA